MSLEFKINRGPIAMLVSLAISLLLELNVRPHDLREAPPLGGSDVNRAL